MLEYGYYNMDCLKGLAEFPDKYFDLAIDDPPYGIKVETYGRKKEKKDVQGWLWRKIMNSLWVEI